MPTVTAEVVGEGEREVALAADATYGDLLASLCFNPHEATVLVDGAPVPEDRPIDPGVGRVRVLRLVKGGSRSESEGVAVRVADADDHLDVMRVVDGAALAADAAAVRDRIAAGTVRVATAGDSVVGALIRDGDRVTAVAVRRRWRDRGIGTALVTAAAADRSRLVAAFDADVRPFYASLGFDVETVEGEPGRFRGVLGT